VTSIATFKNIRAFLLVVYRPLPPNKLILVEANTSFRWDVEWLCIHHNFQGAK
jgi:hypothetical protein